MSERLQVKVYGTPGRQCEISKELLSFLHGKRAGGVKDQQQRLLQHCQCKQRRKRSDIDGLIYCLTGPLKYTNMQIQYQKQ